MRKNSFLAILNVDIRESCEVALFKTIKYKQTMIRKLTCVDNLLVIVVLKRNADVVLVGKVLVVRGGKFGRNRLIVSNTKVLPSQLFRFVQPRNNFVAKPLQDFVRPETTDVINK